MFGRGLTCLWLIVITLIFAAAAFGDVPQIISSVKTEFATYHPVIVPVKPNVLPYIIGHDLENVANAGEFKFSDAGRELLIKNGFVAVPSRFKDIHHIYGECMDNEIPVFVTTDSMLHVYHLLFDRALQTIEMEELFDEAKVLTEVMLKETEKQWTIAGGKRARTAVEKNLAYFSVACKLLDENFRPPAVVSDMVNAELDLIEGHTGFSPSPIFGYDEDYSQYVPRGHYTRHENLEKYFRVMMWYGRMMFRLKPREADGGIEKGKEETLQALLMVAALANAEIERKPLLDVWNRIYQPTVFFVGKTDDLNTYDYMDLMKAVYGLNYAGFEPDKFDDDAKLMEFINAADALMDPGINSTLMFEGEDMIVVKGFRLMGQRFIPDSYMFQELVHDKVQSRLFPKGLDVMAVLGSDRAYDILINRYNEDGYANYVKQVEKLKGEFGSLDPADWAQNLYWNWLYVLTALLIPKGQGYPYFMQNLAWADKELATALGSWAELRHDTILYAKQSYTKMGGGPPRPELTEGYVEPNVEFYARLEALTRFTQDGLSSRGLLNWEIQDKFRRLEELLTELREISEAELQNMPLTSAQYRAIVEFGHTLKQIMPSQNEEMPGDEEEDEGMPVIADVHTDVNTGVVLEEGVGYPMEIFAVVPVEGELKIVRGAMFSYYEFTHPMSDRLTDEKWRDMLENNPKELPEWFDSFVGLPDEPGQMKRISFEAQTAVEPSGKQLATWGKVKQPALYQNYPNPFNPETWIPYQLTSAAEVVIYIYSTNGRLVRVLRLGYKEAGQYITRDRAAYWDGRDSFGEEVASGVYFYTLQAGNFGATGKMIVLR